MKHITITIGTNSRTIERVGDKFRIAGELETRREALTGFNIEIEDELYSRTEINSIMAGMLLRAMKE